MRNSSGLPQGSCTMKPVRLGAGGFVTGISFSSDGATKVIRTDVFNGYVKGAGDKTWRQLLTSQSLPIGQYAGSAGYVAPAGGLVDSTGCYEAVVAPNDATRIYTIWNSRLYKSSDTGNNWTKITAFPDTKAYSNSGGQPHNCGRNMAIDNQNKDAFLIGTQENGLYWSTDGGTTVTNVSIGANDVVGGWTEPSKVVCDPISTVTGGVRQRWFAVRQGTGVYESTTGPGGTFTLMTGSPTRCLDITFDVNGNCWACDPSFTGGQNLWKCAVGGSTWVRQTGMPSLYVVTVAIDPSNANKIVAFNDNGFAVVSVNGGANWLGASPFYISYPVAAGTMNNYSSSISWLGWGRGTGFFPGMVRFNPAVANQLYVADGVAVRRCSPPVTYGGDVPTGRFDWIDESEGIEELVANFCLPLPSGNVLFTCWDKPLWLLPNTNLDKSPVGFPKCPGGTAGSVQHCWHAAYAADNSNYVAALVNWSGQFSGLSTDGGVTWSTFPTPPPNNGNGGCIAIGLAGNIIFIYNNNGQPVYTKDGGSTWATLPFPSLPAAGQETGFGWAYYFNRKIITYNADGNFYLYNYGPAANTGLAGVYKSSNGDTWTKVFNGTLNGTSPYHARLKSVPGQGGHLFYTSGGDQSDIMRRSTDGGVTWSNLSTISFCADIGFGVAAPGQTYPAAYFYATIGGVRGLYRSDDNFATTPKLLTKYPLNSLDGVGIVAGDPNKYGRVYVGFGGSGFAYGDYGSSFSVT